MKNLFYKYFAAALFLFQFLCGATLYAQVQGKVSQPNGEALPFASIYIQGTTRGTTTNLEGQYFLDLDKGIHTLVFQYVGFKTQIKNIEVQDAPVSLDAILQEEAYQLSTVTIRADAEDPAYAIIRKAIAKRKYYLNNIKAYTCDVYIKGNHKLLNAPEKILGQEIGDLEGVLDSNRQGIVYLSESIAKYYFKVPDKRKEIMVSSKISGNDRGYSFNSATEMEANFYQNTINFNRDLVSPIADNALNFYNYKLAGVQIDEAGRWVNKIEVRPKRKYDPTVFGTIYIIEDLWNIQSLNLSTTVEATQVYFLDTLTVKQVYVPVGKEDQWQIFTNNIWIQANLLGFELEGHFSAVYTNYDLNPEFPKSFFDADILVVEKESNKRGDAYWEEVRPVPLLTDERIDYVRRDSIEKIRKSPIYLDSIDRRDNILKISDLIGTYQFRKRKKKLSIDLESPIRNISFNTVQGFNLRMGARLLKYFDEDETKRILFRPNVSYGFSDKQWRAWGSFEYRFNRLKYARIGIEGGRATSQFNTELPVSSAGNAFFSLFFRKNFMKIYDKDFVRLYGQYEIIDGILMSPGLEYNRRKALVNTNANSFFYENSRIYSSNDPQNPELYGIPAFEEHKALLFDINFRIQFGQKYYKYPTSKFAPEATGPELNIIYKAGIELLGSDIDFHHISIWIRDQLNFGARGEWHYSANAGTIFRNQELQFVDFKHFRGHRVFLTNTNNYFRQFLLLPYYSHSTDQEYFQLHTEYHFKGRILDRVPGINKTGWSVVAGAKYLYTTENPHYWELHLGIDQLGFSFFRLLRLDFVTSFEDGDYKDFGVRVGIGL